MEKNPRWFRSRVGPSRAEMNFRKHHRPWLLQVSRLLGRLYGGNPSGYRSFSTHHYLDRPDDNRVVNSIRERFVQPEMYSRDL